jgi:CxxC motif-containing protein (DUF1111 family)
MHLPIGNLGPSVRLVTRSLVVVSLLAFSAQFLAPTHAQTVGGPIVGATAGEINYYNSGVKFFGLVWISDDGFGFGPVFTARGCSTCHGTPNMGGSGPNQVTLFGTLNPDGSFDPMLSQGGPILQPGTIATMPGSNKTCSVPGEVLPASATIVSHRQTPAIYGVSYIDAIPDAAILANASSEASNPTDQALGIHGTANMVPDMLGNIRPGRFGYKGFIVTLLQFTSFAINHDLGVTNLAYPEDDLPQGNPIPAGCFNAQYDLAFPPPNNLPNDPDLTTGRVASTRLTSYLPAYLAAPVPAPLNATTQAGLQTFSSIGCAQCHMISLQTGPNFAVPLDYPKGIGGTGQTRVSPGLSNQTAFLYSDLLIHDMGAGLADGIPQGQATGSQWRTTPLWGMSHKPQLLHDGRCTGANMVTCAIEAHGGEATQVIDNFTALSPGDQANLIAFLGSL